MTRGVGGHSPANVTHHLKGIQFPASKQELSKQAKANDAPDAVLKTVEAMPDEKYQTVADVMKGYGEVE